MRTSVKVVGIAAALGAAAALAIAIAIATIDVRTVVAPLQKRVKEATGRDLAIAGIDLKLSLVPTIVLADVSVGNAPWAKAPHLATAKRVEAQMALLPLLQRRVEIVRIAVTEPVIALEADGKGRQNWAFGRTPEVRAPAAGPPADAASWMPQAFGVDEFTVDKGVLTYRDGAAARTTTVTIDSLAVHARDLRSAIDTRFRGRFDDIVLAVEGTIGPLDAAQLQRGPYPLQLAGEIGGRKASLRTRLGVADGTYRLDDLDLAYGGNHVKGEVAVLPGGARPRLTFRLAAAALAVADLPLPPAVNAPAAGASSAGGRPPAHVFADDPVGFAFLRAVDADGDLAIDRLTLPNGRHLDKVHARLALRDARLEVPTLQAAMFGGSALIALRIDGTREQQPAIKLKLDAKGLDLAALLEAAGNPREVRGGKTDVTLDLAMHGVSPRQWVSGVTGHATAIVGPATLVNTKAGPETAFNRLADLVNPFRGIDATTELQCAVIRLPLVDGVARVERSIAMETKKVGVSASGTLDFRSETLDLSVKPRVKEGVTVKLLELASLVRLTGSFAAPTVGVDARASAQTAARLGAAYASGGLSVLGESLFSGVVEKGAECDVARGREPAKGDANAKPAPPPRAAPAAPASEQRGKGFPWWPRR